MDNMDNNYERNNENQNESQDSYNPYTYNPYNYGAPNPENEPPVNRQKSRRTSSPRKSSGGFGKIILKVIAAALVFSLVTGGVYTGFHMINSRLIGEKVEEGASEQKDNRESEEPEASTEQAAAEEEPEEMEPLQPETSAAVSGLTDVSDIAEAVMPSIVAITNTSTVTYRSIWGQTSSYEASSCGSGIIIDTDDEYYYIATNNHVVADAESLSVKFSDEAIVDAETRGTYPSGDLAVVMVKKSDIPEETLSTIKVIKIGDSSALKVGQPTIAIGNALGYGQSVTTGIVSALGRSVTTKDSTTGTTYTHNNLIQTDAAINPGNSGGALLNSKGELIGINSVKYSSTDVEGIGYAIPMEDAYPIIEALIENGTYLDTQAAYLGITGADVTADIAQTYNMPEGIYVSSVYTGSGAEEAGIQIGDIITQVDDTEVASMDELKAALGNYSAGDTVRLVIYRQNGNAYKGYYVNITLMSAEQMESLGQQ